jgi:S1-C subfamily serine protease
MPPPGVTVGSSAPIGSRDAQFTGTETGDPARQDGKALIPAEAELDRDNTSSLDDVQRGRVVDWRPAAAVGIQAGDVIVSLDDTSIASAPALTEALAALAPGQDVTIELVTMSGRRTVDLRLGQRPPA